MIKPRPGGDKHVEAKTNTLNRVEESQRVVEAAVEHRGVPDGPELLHHSVANTNTTCSVDADEHTPKKASRTTKKPTRKRRSSALNTLSRSTGASRTLGEMAEGQVITEPDQVVDHTAAGNPESRVDRRQSLPSFTFDKAREEVPEDEADPCDCTLSDYPVLLSIGLDEGRHVSQLPRPALPVTPPIWAQVRRIVCGKDNCYMVPSLDRKCARPLTTSGAIKVASIIPMILSKGIFLGPTPPGQCIH